MAKAFASKFRWQIYSSRDTALNFFGLSTQIPAKLVFISNGPSKTLETPFGTICFKLTTEINMDKKANAASVLNGYWSFNF